MCRRWWSSYWLAFNCKEDAPGRSLLLSKLDKATWCGSGIIDLSALNPEVCWYTRDIIMQVFILLTSVKQQFSGNIYLNCTWWLVPLLIINIHKKKMHFLKKGGNRFLKLPGNYINRFIPDVTIIWFVCKCQLRLGLWCLWSWACPF